VLGGSKCFTPDQACALSDYFRLNELETQYLLCLTELELAGTQRLRDTLTKQLSKLNEQSRELSVVFLGKRTLSEEEKAIFYSNWFYTGIWALTSIQGHQTPDAICRYFKLPKQPVNLVVSFLVSTGLWH